MRQIEPQLVQEMVKVGCVLVDNQQDIQRLVDLTVLPNGTPNKQFVGKMPVLSLMRLTFRTTVIHV